MNNIKEHKYIEEELSFRDLAIRIGITDLNTPEVYDIKDEGYEIQSQDKDGNIVWMAITQFVVKESVEQHYQLNMLHGTSEHKVLYKGEYISLKNHPAAELVKQPIQVVDITVPETHNYLAHSQVNHNTSPGGMAIPYAASTRIRLSGGKHIEINGKTIGVEVTAKTIKNKVNRPFRECSFEIHFGKGIVEHEQVFDLFREHCSKLEDKGVIFKNRLINVEGTTAWKKFTVSDTKTGEVLKEVNFHKPEFADKVLNVSEFKEYVDALFDAVFIMKPDQKDHPTFTGITTGENIGPQD